MKIINLIKKQKVGELYLPIIITFIMAISFCSGSFLSKKKANHNINNNTTLKNNKKYSSHHKNNYGGDNVKKRIKNLIHDEYRKPIANWINAADLGGSNSSSLKSVIFETTTDISQIIAKNVNALINNIESKLPTVIKPIMEKILSNLINEIVNKIDLQITNMTQTMMGIINTIAEDILGSGSSSNIELNNYNVRDISEKELLIENFNAIIDLAKPSIISKIDSLFSSGTLFALKKSLEQTIEQLVPSKYFDNSKFNSFFNLRALFANIDTFLNGKNGFLKSISALINNFNVSTTPSANYDSSSLKDPKPIEETFYDVMQNNFLPPFRSLLNSEYQLIGTEMSYTKIKPLITNLISPIFAGFDYSKKSALKLINFHTICNDITPPINNFFLNVFNNFDKHLAVGGLLYKRMQDATSNLNFIDPQNVSPPSVNGWSSSIQLDWNNLNWTTDFDFTNYQIKLPGFSSYKNGNNIDKIRGSINFKKLYVVTNKNMTGPDNKKSLYGNVLSVYNSSNIPESGLNFSGVDSENGFIIKQRYSLCIMGWLNVSFNIEVLSRDGTITFIPKDVKCNIPNLSLGQLMEYIQPPAINIYVSTSQNA